jgi:hypothetical protein
VLSLPLNPLVDFRSLHGIRQRSHHIPAGLVDVLNARCLQTLQEVEDLLPVFDALCRVHICHSATLGRVRGEYRWHGHALLDQGDFIGQVVCVCDAAVQA